MKVIREAYRAGESWPFFVTLERGEGIGGYYRVDYESLLALADELDTVYCPDCGEWDMVVRRIRRALGVEE